VAFLVDSEAYYTTALALMRNARRSIHLLGWAFDPRARLAPDGEDGPHDADEVGHVLRDLARARPELDIRLLIWKSALPIRISHGFFPHKARPWFAGTSVRFRLDDKVPFGAAQHQKVLVIDDAVAICGSADFAIDRWDSSQHLDHDIRRIMPKRLFHGPRHEVMMMVDGAAARALGDLFRERWAASEAETLPPATPTILDPWPTEIAPVLQGAQVAVVRTRPAWREQDPVDEVLQLTLASIAEARETIYLENQYFACARITAALAARLAEPDGPEVILVSTGRAPSWFDHLTMDTTRAAMLKRLAEADHHDRFRAYYPVTPKGARVIVHSKLCIIDDRLARVGSANLNNRSGGFDSECDLAIEADDAAARRGVADFRDGLLAHFLGVERAALTQARAAHGGLIGAVEALNGAGRLARFSPMKLGLFGRWMAAHSLGDPHDIYDSWRLILRRDRLAREARALPAARSGERKIHDQRQVI
jgi:phosphatidylserine/phosphatidylglycerophosphate/cardiolipin synthase-like enzyme